MEALYEKRIKMEIINGVYIPHDLEDAFRELNRLTEPKALIRFKNSPEDSIRRKLHFGLGRWIHVNWGLEEGSRISHYFKLKGVSMPDDIVELIILAWHRHLNGVPLRLEEEIAVIQQRIADELKAREAGKTKTVIERRPRKE
jgi:hypothetical protein